MARIPCSFSAQEDFLSKVDARAQDLGMKRSEYIVHALRMELARGGAMTIPSNQGSGRSANLIGDGNVAITGDFTRTSTAPVRKSVASPEGKRGKKTEK